MVWITAPKPPNNAMRQRGGVASALRRWAQAALLACGVAALLFATLVVVGCGGRAEGAQLAAITEFPAGESPTNIASGPDGNLWFTELFRSSIGRITPAGGVTVFSEGITPMPPYSMGGLLAVAAGPDGNVWFTEGERDKVGRITPSGVVTEFSQGITPGSFTGAIAAGPDGNLWFTENRVNQIGRITPSGVVTEFSDGITPGGLQGTGLGDIAAGPDGNLWFAEPGNRIGRITPSGVVTEFPLDIDLGSPGGLAAGPTGTSGSGRRGAPPASAQGSGASPPRAS